MIDGRRKNRHSEYKHKMVWYTSRFSPHILHVQMLIIFFLFKEYLKIECKFDSPILYRPRMGKNCTCKTATIDIFGSQTIIKCN